MKDNNIGKLVFVFIMWFIVLSSLCGCRTRRAVEKYQSTNIEDTIKHTDSIIYRDTIIYKDSVKYKDTVIYIKVPTESHTDVVRQLDTLRLNTSIASASAWFDTTTNTLKGNIFNLDTVFKTNVVYKDRVVIQYKDLQNNTAKADTVTKYVTKVDTQTETITKRKYGLLFWLLLGYFGCSLVVIAYKNRDKIGNVVKVIMRMT